MRPANNETDFSQNVNCPWWMLDDVNDLFLFLMFSVFGTNHAHFPPESRFELLIHFLHLASCFRLGDAFVVSFFMRNLYNAYGGMCRLHCHQRKAHISSLVSKKNRAMKQIDWIRERNEKLPHHWWRRCSPEWKLNKYCINTNSFAYIRSCGRITGNFRFRFYVPARPFLCTQAAGIGFKWIFDSLHAHFLGCMIYSTHNFMQLEA